MMRSLVGRGMWDVNGEGWEGMGEVMKEMMQPYRVGPGRVFWQYHWLLEIITWALVIAFLAAAVRWLWKKGDEAGKKR